MSAQTISGKPWERPDWLGSGSGDVAEAVEFARECGIEWGTRTVVRLEGGRTVKMDGSPDPDGRLLWTVHAAPSDVERASE